MDLILNYGIFIELGANIGCLDAWDYDAVVIIAEEKMETDLGKLFIGGVSWDTDDDHLREYFRTYGEVVEAVIMKDRTTGRARGFGFVVFADPAETQFGFD